MKKSSLYTKRGDGGKTAFFDGTRVDKSHDLLNCCGGIDELNSFIGLLSAHIDPDSREEGDLLKTIQGELFTLGVHLMTTVKQRRPPMDEGLLLAVEKRIDALDEKLPPLKNFILPSGTKGASVAHICRSVCRRIERDMAHIGTRFPEHGGVSPPMQSLINRLSDYFFVLARVLNHRGGKKDDIWNPSPEKEAP